LATIAVSCTAAYSIRLLYYVFFNNVNVMVNIFLIKESPIFSVFVLSVLCLLSVIIGFLVKDFFVGLGVDI